MLRMMRRSMGRRPSRANLDDEDEDEDEDEDDEEEHG